MSFPSSLTILQLCLVALPLVLIIAVLRRGKKLAATASLDEKTLTQIQESPSKVSGPLSVPTMENDPKATPLPKVTVDIGAARQTYDAFLVLDVEGTCQMGTDFNYANEIIASHLAILFLSGLSDSCSPSSRNGPYVSFVGSIGTKVVERAGWRK